MDNISAEAIHGLQATPELLVLVLLVAIVVGGFIKIIPMVNSHLEQKLKAESEYKAGRLKLEEQREQRKNEEFEAKLERERENATLMSRSIDAQERSTIAINESTAQMAVLTAKLEISQKGSEQMKGTVDGMAREVHDIHHVIVDKTLVKSSVEAKK